MIEFTRINKKLSSDKT